MPDVGEVVLHFMVHSAVWWSFDISFYWDCFLGVKCFQLDSRNAKISSHSSLTDSVFGVREDYDDRKALKICLLWWKQQFSTHPLGVVYGHPEMKETTNWSSSRGGRLREFVLTTKNKPGHTINQKLHTTNGPGQNWSYKFCLECMFYFLFMSH